MFNIGSQELIVILLIALIVVGPQRLPELSRSIGKGLRELRKVQDDMKDMVKLDLEPERDRPAPARRPASPTAPGVHRTPKPAPPPSQTAGPVPSAADGPAEPAEGPAAPAEGPTPGPSADPSVGTSTDDTVPSG